MFAGQDLYYFKPNAGGQADAWSSQKDIVFISGGNRSGKSTLLCHLAASYNYHGVEGLINNATTQFPPLQSTPESAEHRT